MYYKIQLAHRIMYFESLEAVEEFKRSVSTATPEEITEEQFLAETKRR